jgi:hypothetical protein
MHRTEAGMARAEQLKRDPDKLDQQLEERLRANLQKTGDFSRIHRLPHSGAGVPDDLETRLVVCVLVQAIRDGGAMLTWRPHRFAYAESYDEATCRYRGLRGGSDDQRGNTLNDCANKHYYRAHMRYLRSHTRDLVSPRYLVVIGVLRSRKAPKGEIGESHCPGNDSARRIPQSDLGSRSY